MLPSKLKILQGPVLSAFSPISAWNFSINYAKYILYFLDYTLALERYNTFLKSMLEIFGISYIECTLV